MKLSQSFSDNNAQTQNVENNQQLIHQMPPIPDLFPQNFMQQLNLNNNHQLPANQCSNHQLNLNSISNHNYNSSDYSNSSRILNSQSASSSLNNQQNLHLTNYSTNNCNLRNDNFKNFYIQSPTSSKSDKFCSFCNLNQIHNPDRAITSNHLTSIISKNTTKDINWQSTFNTVRQRNACLFNNEYMSDIAFLVGNLSNTDSKDSNLKDGVCRIPAHRYILASGSTVFYAMLYGGLAEKSSLIELPDLEPKGFLTLLKYLYCDDISLDSDSVLSTFYASKKYIVPYLAKACINFLYQILNSQNACFLLSQIRLFDGEQIEQEFINQCYCVIDAQTELALKSPSFVEIDEGTLELILQRELLNTRELFIFDACLRWAEKECERQNLDLNPKNKRKVLNKIIYLIRIPTISLSEFANGPAQSSILNSDEITKLFLFYTAKNQPTDLVDKFNFKKRKGLKLYVVRRFKSYRNHHSQWRYRNGKCDSIQFSVDKKIFLVGFGLFGSYSPACSVYKLKMELKKNCNILANKNTQLVSDGSSRTFRLMFDYPIEIYPNQLYTASVYMLDGNNSVGWYGQDGLTEIDWNNKITFDFQCSPDSVNGTGVTGGQIPELLFYFPSLDNELLGTDINKSNQLEGEIETIK